MTESYDLIVIGTGQGGSGPATRCRKAGWRVAVIDDQPYGGTCALRGCDPKKVLVGASELMDWHRRMSASVVAPDPRIDWPALMRFKRTFTEPVPAVVRTACTFTDRMVTRPWTRTSSCMAPGAYPGRASWISARQG